MGTVPTVRLPKLLLCETARGRPKSTRLGRAAGPRAARILGRNKHFIAVIRFDRVFLRY